MRRRAFGARAEYVRTFGKGTRVLAVGRLEINQYQSREGETRTGFDVLADEVVAMSPRQGGPPSEAAFDAARESFGDELTDVIRDVDLLAVGRTGKIARLSTFALHAS